MNDYKDDDKDLLGKVLSNLESAIVSNTFIDVETSLIELKDLSSGTEWTSLKQTICAYLNTKGGYIICGIRERDKSYSFPGFDKNNEGKLLELKSNFFKNDSGSLLDLSDNLYFEYREFNQKTIAIIRVRPLSEDLKYVQYNNQYYERDLTQDKIISPEKVKRHIEYKTELEYSKELSPVRNTTIDDIDIDKINQFIIKINTTGQKETVKRDIDDAYSFLKRRYCLNEENQVTTLGILLFGKDPFQKLEYRAEVDCYFETGNDIGRDKKFLQNDVLSLMDDTFSFVWSHIKVGRSFVGGGRSEPEFPEKLIREVINNALAHRDYTINKFITVKINPGENIEVKNPGAFKQKMLIINTNSPVEIRRIIPGMPETKNPKLANVLKAFDKIESQGIGMATLVSVALENQIDVPYYNLSNPEEISLVIPSGKLIDDETQFWLNSYYKYIDGRLQGKTTKQHELVLAYFLKTEKLNQKRFFTILLSESNNHFQVIQDLKESELIIEIDRENNQYNPIYILDRELITTNFIPKIEQEFQINLSTYDDRTRRVLNIIYRYNKYNNQSIKPNVITPELYHQLFGNKIVATKYESLGRNVRKICANLLNAGLLVKRQDKSYEISGNQNELLSPQTT